VCNTCADKPFPAFFEFQASIKINNLHGINVEVSDDSRHLPRRGNLRKDHRLSFWLAQGANRRGPVTPSVVLVARLFTRGGALVSIIAEKFWADPTQINPWPASQKFGGILWANSAHGVSFAGCAGS
jgi:hypothetical protein